MTRNRPSSYLYLLLALASATASPKVARAAEWVPIGPDGGGVTALAEAPNGRTLYAGSQNAGVFKSADSGRSWRHLPERLPEVTSLAVDAASSATVYAGTTAGLFQSRDGGTTWRRMELNRPSFPSNSPVSAVLADPRQPGTCWVAFFSQARLYRTMDRGDSWEPRANGLAGVQVNALSAHPRIDGRLYAATSNGVFASRDAGAHWFRLGLRDKTAIGVAVDAGGEEIVHAVTLEPVNHYGVSKNVPYLRTPATGDFHEDFAGLGPVSGIYTRVEADPRTSGLAYATTSIGLYVQTRAGGTWNSLYAQGAGAILPSRFRAGTIFAVTAPFGDPAILRSRDSGDSWQPADHGLSLQVVCQIAPDPLRRSTLFARVGCCELRRTADDGATWTRIGDRLPLVGFGHLLPDPDHLDTMYFVTAGQLWKSFDGGDRWQPTGEGSPSAIALDRSPANLLYAADSIVGILRRSPDGGATWEQLPAADGYYADLLAVAPPIGPGPRAAYASGRNYDVSGPYLYQDHLRRSTDGGTTWSVLFTLPRGDSILTDIEVSATVPPRIYAAYYDADRNFHPFRGGIFRSLDGGATWKSLPVSSESPPVATLVLDPSDAAHLVAGAPKGGVFESHDGGTTWTSIGQGLPAADVTSLELDPHDPRRLYVALSGGGAFRRDL